MPSNNGDKRRGPDYDGNIFHNLRRRFKPRQVESHDDPRPIIKGSKKIRKDRGYKLSGRKSEDMCEGCQSFGCDPMADSPAWAAKKDRRRAAGVCVSCGNNPCTCKSRIGKLKKR